MSSNKIRIAIVLLTIALLFSGAYFYWTTTPLFVFQEAAFATREHDLAKFEKYVDAQGLIDSAVNEVLINPIETMPGLSEIGRRVAVAAIGLSVGPIETKLLRHLEDHVSGIHRVSALPQRQKVAGADADQYANVLGDSQTDPDQEMSVAPGPYRLVSYNAAGSLSNVLAVTRQEVHNEFERLRKIAYDRMQFYASMHQQGIVGRLLSMANDPRPGQMSSLLTEYGLTKENLKGVAYCSTTNDGTGELCKIGFKFFSPKVSHTVILEFELLKTPQNWRITRLSNLPTLLSELDPSYQSDFQNLIQTAVQGISSRSVQNEVGNLAKRITDSDAVKKFLHGLNSRTLNPNNFR